MEPFIRVDSVRIELYAGAPRILYIVAGNWWTPGVTVYATFQYLQHFTMHDEIGWADTGPVMMSNSLGEVRGYWVSEGIKERVKPEYREVIATTNDGTGRTARWFVEGPMAEDPADD